MQGVNNTREHFISQKLAQGRRRRGAEGPVPVSAPPPSVLSLAPGPPRLYVLQECVIVPAGLLLSLSGGVISNTE